LTHPLNSHAHARFGLRSSAVDQCRPVDRITDDELERYTGGAERNGIVLPQFDRAPS
jgi:hypothetical protein